MRTLIRGCERHGSLYYQLYEKHFGKKLYASRAHIASCMYRVEKFCASQGYDLATYVAAQMHGCRDIVATLRRGGRLLGFQPNMLLGGSAMRRYAMYAHAGQQRFRQTGVEVFSSATVSGRQYEILLGEEMERGEEFYGAGKAGKKVSLVERSDLHRKSVCAGPDTRYWVGCCWRRG